MKDSLTIVIATLALLFSFGTFAWQHLRIIDAGLCALVTSSPDKLSATFDFAVSNLGTRPLLLRGIQVRVHLHPEMFGTFMLINRPLRGALPQVIEPGKISTIEMEARWTETFLIQSAKACEERGIKNAELYFEAVALFWNLEGKRLVARKHIATISYDTVRQGFSYWFDDKGVLKFPPEMKYKIV